MVDTVPLDFAHSKRQIKKNLGDWHQFPRHPRHQDSYRKSGLHHLGIFDDFCYVFFFWYVKQILSTSRFSFLGNLTATIADAWVVHFFSYPMFWEGLTEMFRSFSFDQPFLLLISPLHLPSGQQVRMLLKVIFEKNKSLSKEILVPKGGFSKVEGL